MKKDENKMIEDMRAIIQREHSGCMSNLCENCEYYAMNYCGSVKKANALYNANCRIIADDEIVIKKSEYEKKLNDYYEQGRASAFGDIEEQKDVRILTKEEFYNLKPTLIYDIEAIDKAKQETAIEILQTILDESGIDMLGNCYRLPTRVFNKIKYKYGIELE